MVCIISNLLWYKDVRFLSPGLVNDVDVIDEDVLQAATEIWCGRQVRQVLLYYSSYIQLRGLKQSVTLIKPELKFTYVNIQ